MTTLTPALVRSILERQVTERYFPNWATLFLEKYIFMNGLQMRRRIGPV